MIDQTLINLLPPLRRARGDRLYGADQKHWVDLWKQDGAWLFGHRPEGAAKEWKNQVDKGLALWTPSRWPSRLELIVRQLIPGAGTVRIVRNVDRAPEGAVWRPWSPDLALPALVPGVCNRLVLPTGPGSAVALAWDSSFEGPFPEHELTSPADAAALVYAAAQVLRFERDARAAAARRGAAESFDRLIGPCGVFARQGLWFTADPTLDYSEVFRTHLEAGFFLSPDAQGPGLIPTGLSDGEWQAWAKAAKSARGGD